MPSDSHPPAQPIWDPAESLPRDQLEALQLDRLQSLVARVAEVPFYRDTFAANNITPDSI